MKPTARSRVVSATPARKEPKNIADPNRVYTRWKPVRAQPSSPRPPEPKSAHQLVLVSAGIAVLLILVAAGASVFPAANRSVPRHRRPAGCACVWPSSSLPFANLSGDPAQDYLADALTDQRTHRYRAPPRQLS